jgi:predicted nucleic acid-binding protein
VAKARRDKEYLGIDSNVLVAFLIDNHPDHDKVKGLLNFIHVINPTVIHEVYHTCVFKLRIDAKVIADILIEYIDNTLFLPITYDTTRLGLRIAVKYMLGGRDALIIASYLNSNIRRLVTFDKELLKLNKIALEGKRIDIIKP